MPRFDFQLEGVLRHRLNIERQRQRELAVFQSQMHQHEEALRALDKTVQEATADIRENRLVGSIDMNFITAHRRFVAAHQRKAIALAQRMALVQRQMEQARASLTDAATKRKIVEKIRDKQFARWKQAIEKKELNELDEIAMQLEYRREADERHQLDDGSER